MKRFIFSLIVVGLLSGCAFHDRQAWSYVGASGVTHQIKVFEW